MITPEWLKRGVYGAALDATAPGMDAPDLCLAIACIDMLPLDGY